MEDRRLKRARKALERLNAEERAALLAEQKTPASGRPAVIYPIPAIDPYNIVDNAAYQGSLVKAALYQISCDTWDRAWAIVEEYLSPFTLALYRVFCIACYIEGVAVAGFGGLPIAAIQDVVTEFFAALADLDVKTAALSHALQLSVPDHLDMQYLQSLYEAVRAVASGQDRNGDKLRAVIDRSRTPYRKALALRPKYQPGRERGVDRRRVALKEKIREIKDRQGGTWDTATALYVADLKSRAHLSPDEQWELTALDIDDPGTFVRQLPNRNRLTVRD